MNLQRHLNDPERLATIKRYSRELWYITKEILFDQTGNGRPPARVVIFDSYEKAKGDCLKYAGPQRPCSYCCGERQISNVNVKKLRDRPDEYKEPPPGAKDLKILVRKGGEEWAADFTVKCQKCGAEETQEFRDHLYGSYEARTRVQSSQRCFIATAVYGSPAAQEVVNLRRFRDTFLSSFFVGKVTVEVYYLISPTIARTIKKHSSLRKLFELLLLPISKVLRWKYRAHDQPDN